MKVYIHHKYNKQLFYRFAHNTSNRVFNIDESIGYGDVMCEYNGKKVKFIFTDEFNNDTDSFHIVDYYETILNGTLMKHPLNITTNIYDIPFFKLLNNLLGSEKNWIITMTRTEKLYGDSVHFRNTHIDDLETYIKKLNNHRFVHDNYFLNDEAKQIYKNNYFAFTNTIMQWNAHINIRYYYEFKSVFERLNFNYDLCFSMRFPKPHRIEILKKLKNLGNERILLQRTDSIAVMNEKRLGRKHFDRYDDILSNISLNSILGENDFANLTWIEYIRGINWDIFFRLLSKAKMQVLDETHSGVPCDFSSIYISEKTIGLILAGIPFISTHSYPLEILERVLGIEPHPFMNNFKLHKGDTKLFVDFVKVFMENYDENYQLCKEWSNKCNKLFVDKLETENSLLDLMTNEFNKDYQITKPTIKLI